MGHCAAGKDCIYPQTTEGRSNKGHQLSSKHTFSCSSCKRLVCDEECLDVHLRSCGTFLAMKRAREEVVQEEAVKRATVSLLSPVQHSLLTRDHVGNTFCRVTFRAASMLCVSMCPRTCWTSLCSLGPRTRSSMEQIWPNRATAFRVGWTSTSCATSTSFQRTCFTHTAVRAGYLPPTWCGCGLPLS